MDNLILQLAQLATEKINWTDEVFKKWLSSGNEAYLFLILVVLSLLAIVTSLIFLFKLYIGEKDSKYKVLAEMEKEVEKEKQKIRTENKTEIDKWIEKWSKKTEDYSFELITAIKFNNQALEDIYEELEKIKQAILSQKNCKGGDKIAK